MVVVMCVRSGWQGLKRSHLISVGRPRGQPHTLPIRPQANHQPLLTQHRAQLRDQRQRVAAADGVARLRDDGALSGAGRAEAERPQALLQLCLRHRLPAAATCCCCCCCCGAHIAGAASATSAGHCRRPLQHVALRAAVEAHRAAHREHAALLLLPGRRAALCSAVRRAQRQVQRHLQSWGRWEEEGCIQHGVAWGSSKHAWRTGTGASHATAPMQSIRASQQHALD